MRQNCLKISLFLWNGRVIRLADMQKTLERDLIGALFSIQAIVIRI